MSEQLTSYLETPSYSEAIDLHNESFELPRGKFLYNLEETRSFGFNAVTVAEIVLPTLADRRAREYKTLAILDYGKDIPAEGKPIFYSDDPDLSLVGYGVTHHRFNLVGINYQPDNVGLAYRPLVEGKTLSFGSDSSSPTNYYLGLSEPGNNSLSKSHVSLTIGKKGRISIEDHSVNGTAVICRV